MLQLKHSSCAAHPDSSNALDAKGDDLNSRNIINKFPWNIENLYIKTNSHSFSPPPLLLSCVKVCMYKELAT